MTKAANSAVQNRPVINGRRWSHLTSPAASSTITLISRGLTVYASNNDGVNVPANAVDSDYTTTWGAASLAATYALDISGVSVATQADGVRPVLFAWHSKELNFSHGVNGQTLSTCPGNYTIEVNTAAGGSLPGSGWTTAKTVTSNGNAARSHIIDVAGKNWIRINITGDAEAGTYPSSINIDLWNVSGATMSSNALINAGWLTVGDSITAAGMALCVQTGVGSRNAMGDQIFTAKGTRIFQINSGHYGYESGDVLSLMSGYLTNWPGKYVMVNLGTNDAYHGITTAQYKTNMQSIISLIKGAGCTAVISTIPWNSGIDMSPYNTKIAEILAADSAVVAGTDLYAYFNANQAQITGNDGTHPTSTGYVNLMTQHVNRVAAIEGL